MFCRPPLESWASLGWGLGDRGAAGFQSPVPCVPCMQKRGGMCVVDLRNGASEGERQSTQSCCQRPPQLSLHVCLLPAAWPLGRKCQVSASAQLQALSRPSQVPLLSSVLLSVIYTHHPLQMGSQGRAFCPSYITYGLPFAYLLGEPISKPTNPPTSFITFCNRKCLRLQPALPAD